MSSQNNAVRIIATGKGIKASNGVVVEFYAGHPPCQAGVSALIYPRSESDGGGPIGGQLEIKVDDLDGNLIQCACQIDARYKHDGKTDSSTQSHTLQAPEELRSWLLAISDTLCTELACDGQSAAAFLDDVAQTADLIWPTLRHYAMEASAQKGTA